MIIVLTGDNIYEIDQELGRIVAGFNGEVERLDGDSLEVRDLTDIFSGVSLFATERLVVVKRLSENASVWEALASWAEQSSDTILVLVEPKVDKRTKTYKAFAKYVDVRTFAAWGERDTVKAEKWLSDEAVRRDIALAPAAAREIVRRRGVEQYQLVNTLEQLAVLGDITPEIVDTHIEKTPHDNVFELLSAALTGDTIRVRRMIQALRPENDPYMTLGLLASQIFALSGLVLSDKSQADVASDLGVSPYTLRGLTRSAESLDRTQLRVLVGALADADSGLKSSSVDPWVQIEIALTKR
ncbi:DNA polymerase III subunit delta [Candidatus Mycosynbacter amalyticus]|uniref:DNA polymerase III subunit delta n=1 Tax=Candidatus Mycosynbacter amalyticus TaxID=2665156 RepID=UPI0021B18A3C|nr:DNA polymerase III subunit delta [Candidatus Mycosynbacter amalyticus]